MKIFFNVTFFGRRTPAAGKAGVICRAAFDLFSQLWYITGRNQRTEVIPMDRQNDSAMTEGTTVPPKRTAKDSVFCDLFRDPENLLEL